MEGLPLTRHKPTLFLTLHAAAALHGSPQINQRWRAGGGGEHIGTRGEANQTCCLRGKDRVTTLYSVTPSPGSTPRGHAHLSLKESGEQAT